eukprot:scaffold1938_cov399-Prasinococcus_capsulatus_cf.AAC.27
MAAVARSTVRCSVPSLPVRCAKPTWSRLCVLFVAACARGSLGVAEGGFQHNRCVDCRAHASTFKRCQRSERQE